MDNRKILSELAGLAERLGIQVTERVLKTTPIRVRSGLCAVRGDLRLIVDRKLTDEDKIDVYVENLARISMDDMYVVPVLRDLIQKHRERFQIVPQTRESLLHGTSAPDEPEEE